MARRRGRASETDVINGIDPCDFKRVFLSQHLGCCEAQQWHTGCSTKPCDDLSEQPSWSGLMAMEQPLDVLRRVKGEYLEMPGLRLTIAQAQRLWGLDRSVCDALLGALVEAKFLFRTRDGAFVRADHAVGTS